jgi:hypothetical protein
MTDKVSIKDPNKFGLFFVLSPQAVVLHIIHVCDTMSMVKTYHFNVQLTNRYLLGYIYTCLLKQSEINQTTMPLCSILYIDVHEI